MNDTQKTSGRLYSLDVLRGLDIFFLTVLGGLIWSFGKVCALPAWVTTQLGHPDWVGFTAYDMIMPLFIFMCGAALPLALPKRLDADGTAGRRYWLHVAGRVALLWFFGLIAQGELLSFDLHRISFFNNTLQTIACGYLIAAAVARIPSRAVRIAVPFVLAAAYTAFLHLCGDLTPTGNAAIVYETKFLLLFYPDATWHPVSQIAGWHYSWWTTVPMFGVMALAGMFATEIVKGAAVPLRKAATLAAVGVGLLALGGVLATFDPVVKHIFTASFTALAMGVAYLLYALFYWLCDIVGWRRGTGLLNLFGRHSLLAYMYGVFFGSAAFHFGQVFLCSRGAGFDKGISRFFTNRPLFDFVFAIFLAALMCAVLWAWDEWKRLHRKAS